MRSAWGTEEHTAAEQRHAELANQRDQYLRNVLARLPFRWHVEHAYTPRETATHGGGDHVVVDEKIQIGRLVRHPGDALSRSRAKFWGLHAVEEGRLPNSLADIKIAERITMTPPPHEKAAKKPAKQLAREIADALRRR